MPARVDAIVVLGGPGDGLAKGVELAHRGRAPVLVLSAALSEPMPADLYGRRDPTLKVVCFQPEPGTTQGGGQVCWPPGPAVPLAIHGAGDTPDQDTRARIRFGRCFGGSIYVVTIPLPASLWVYQLAYQWAATFKAVVLQRSC
jgi:hypothetical protein